MKVWIVCDNNVASTIIVFTSLKKAQKYVNQYKDFEKNDCWIFDRNGTKVMKINVMFLNVILKIEVVLRLVPDFIGIKKAVVI